MTDSAAGEKTRRSFELERISDSSWIPPWIRFQHVERYRFAQRLVKGKRVADGASGVGYGSAMLADADAAFVEGFDLSPDAIATARRVHDGPRRSFTAADLCSIPRPDESFDVFVSFETIEHIDDATHFVAEIARVLTPGGLLICSTPNRLVTNPGLPPNGAPYNQYHVREFTREELRTLFADRFDNITFYGQKPYRLSYIRMLGAVGRAFSPIIAVRAHQMRKVLSVPFDKTERHRPVPYDGTGEPEYHVFTAIRR